MQRLLSTAAWAEAGVARISGKAQIMFASQPGKVALRSVITLFTSALLAVTVACASSETPAHRLRSGIFYVSHSGAGTNGLSWATAWRDTSLIDWSVIGPGSQIILDGSTSTCSVSPYDYNPSSPNPGVTCGQRYHPFSIGQNDIIIERSTAAGHNGTVVIDGGRETPLPYCGQKSYSAAMGASAGIDLNGHSGVEINGMARSGIVVRGARNGILMLGGGHDILRNMEIFDNGFAISHSWGYSSDGNGVLMGGADNIYDRLLIHDNGQDEFHSDAHGYNESGSTLSNSWLGAIRENPNYPSEPFNDLQASGHDPGCTHADGMQIFAPGVTMSGLTFNYDVFGPGVNQDLYPSDRHSGTTFYDVTIDNSLFLPAASTDINNDNPVQGWNFSHDTIFATRGALEIPGNGRNAMNDVIKYGGFVSGPGGSWTTSGNVWYGGDPLPGTPAHLNPGFTSVPAATSSLVNLRAANLTPSDTTSGSPLHSWLALLARIDSLNHYNYAAGQVLH
jgi:hypothetical protein